MSNFRSHYVLRYLILSIFCRENEAKHWSVAFYDTGMVCNIPFFLDCSSKVTYRLSNITTGNSSSLSVCIRHKISFIIVCKENNLSVLRACKRLSSWKLWSLIQIVYLAWQDLKVFKKCNFQSWLWCSRDFRSATPVSWKRS